MTDADPRFFDDILGVVFVKLLYMDDGRVLVLFKFETNSEEKKHSLKDTINSLTGTMGGDGIYFGNSYGNDTMDFFFNIELKKDKLIDKLSYIRTILNRAVRLIENKVSLISFSMEVDTNAKFATYSYLSYLPQYLQNLDIPVSVQSSMVDELIKISILQLNNGHSAELRSALGAFLLLPSMNGLKLDNKCPEVSELYEQVELYKRKLYLVGSKSTPIEMANSQVVEKDQPIELFGGYVKIPALVLYGIEINVPRMINSLKDRRKNQNKQ